MPDMKRNVKDSVFTYLFRHPEYARELYLSLHPEDSAVTERDLRIITLENILTTGQYNDFGLLARETIILLVEAQSTFTVNVCIRLLLYLAQSYKEYIVENDLDLYSAKAALLPVPELYVVYTGSQPDVPAVLKLSDRFLGEGNGAVELQVKVLRKGSSGDILDQYIRFCEIQTEQRNLHGYSQKSIEETIRVCKEEGILTLFLSSREKEVKDIMFTLFDQEWVTKVHEAALVRDAKEEGERKGKREGTLENLRNMMDSLGIGPEQAMSALKLSAAEQAEYRKLLELR